MPSSQANIHLYNCADKAVQNAIINTHPNFFTADPDKLLDMVEILVTQRSNPIVHHLAFASMCQDENEPMQNYLVRLRAVTIDCNFTCPLYNLSNIYVVHSISFQTFFVQAFKIVIDSWKFSVITIHLMRWLTNFYDLRFKWTATPAIGIHPTKAWLSQLVNFKNAIWMWGRMICNKILF